MERPISSVKYSIYLSNACIQRWAAIAALFTRYGCVKRQLEFDLMRQRLIKNENGGSIINISSLYGLREGLTKVPYNVSKAGVAQLTKTMAAEMAQAKQPIRVNTLCPTYFLTELNDDYFNFEKALIILSKHRQVDWGS
jgi:NAD(P)-dependent dehydrogenase (short-subunit alcohol dehydrogenase family)